MEKMIKRIILVNVFIFLACLLYYIFNSSLFNYIYFYPAQPLFTRTQYQLFFLFGLFFFILVCWLIKREYQRIDHETSKKIILFELVIFMIIFALTAIVYLFYVHYPLHLQSNSIIPAIYYPIFDRISWFYLFEFVGFMFVISRVFSKKSVLEYVIKSIEVILIYVALITPAFIDWDERSISFMSARFVENYYYVFAVIPIAYILYFIRSNKKYKMAIDFIIVAVIITIMLIQKNPENYFFTDRIHFWSRPFIGYYLLATVIGINVFDFIRLIRSK